jgi:enoyl-CoA hydratase
VDALLGGFRFHSGQKTANFMNEYNQEVSAVIYAAKEANKASVAANEKPKQIIVSRRTLLDLNIVARCEMTIASFSLPVAMMIKESVNRAFESSLNEGLLYERRVFHSAFGLDDQKEGMSAFVEKRKANFQHR